MTTLTDVYREIGIRGTNPEHVQAVDDYITTRIREELATLGGHLLKTYGTKPVKVSLSYETIPENPELGTLGGYLLQRYGTEKSA